MNVSVLVATYGTEQWRRQALARAVPSAWTAGASEVLTWHEPVGTLATARNWIAEHAKGPYLCFLDADDELLPGYFDAMSAAYNFQRAKHVAAAGLAREPLLLAPAVEYVSATGGRVAGPSIPNKGMWPEVNECVIGTLVEKSVFMEAGGFDEEWPIYEDYALWLACERLGARIVHVEDAVYRAYVNANGRNTGPSSTVKLITYNEIRRRDQWAREGRES